MKTKIHICLGPFKTGTSWLWENLKQDSKYSTFYNIKEPFLWTVNLPPNRTTNHTRKEWFEFADKTEKILLDFSQGYDEIVKHPNNVKNLISNYDVTFFVVLKNPIDLFVTGCNFTGNPVITNTTNPNNVKNILDSFSPLQYSHWLPVWLEKCNVICINFNKFNDPEYLNKKFDVNLKWDIPPVGASKFKFLIRSQWHIELEQQMVEYFKSDIDYISKLQDE